MAWSLNSFHTQNLGIANCLSSDSLLRKHYRVFSAFEDASIIPCVIPTDKDCQVTSHPDHLESWKGGSSSASSYAGQNHSSWNPPALHLVSSNGPNKKSTGNLKITMTSEMLGLRDYFFQLL